MLSTSSLQAFSSAATTAPINRPAPGSPIRLVRGQQERAPAQASGALQPLPEARPSLPPPRGSLLNLSV